MASTQTEVYVPLKLVVDEKRNKVIFAEAGKDFVDVLISFLSFSLGTITGLVQNESNMEPVTIGCLNNLYQSVADLDKECMKNTISKNTIGYSFQDYCRFLKLNIDDTPTKNGFSWIHDLFFENDNLRLRIYDGFVKEGATFVITDDLRVMSNSTEITSFGMLQNLGIIDASSVKEITVNVTKEKVLDLLKCSLVSKSTLSDSFLGLKPTLGSPSSTLICDFEFTKDIQITLKLVMRKSDGKILYAEGDWFFANLLLTVITFPMVVIVRMFGLKSSLGSIESLYQSIVDLDEKYYVSKEAKNMIFNFEDKYLTEGYVKGSRTYVATDDLVVTELSPALALSLIKSFETPLSDLKEEVITLGQNEILNLWKAALTSTSALTDGLRHLLN